MPRQAFIVGGAGQIGRAVASALLDQGWRVTLSSRGQRPMADDLIARGAEVLAMDREETGALARALKGGADAVIDTVAYAPAHADQLLEAQGDVGAFVAISSASVYRDEDGRNLNQADETGFPLFPGAIAETTPTVAPGVQTYAARKVALEQRLLDHARAPVTILRPCAIHGTHSVHPREWWFVKRLRDHRPVIPLAYRGHNRFHTSAVANIAALVLAALEKPGSRILNIGDPQAPTVAEIGTLIARHLDYPGTIQGFDLGGADDFAAVGDTPWSAPASFVLDMDAAAALGYRPATTYADAVGAICDGLMDEAGDDWQARFPVLAAYPCDLFDYTAEDRFLQSHI